MSLSVYSEIGALKEVLVHAPGEEVDVMPPAMMEELLFDDIIYGPRARLEHAHFRAVMEKLGAIVRDTQTLLREAIETSPRAAHELIRSVDTMERLDPETLATLEAADAAQLSRHLVGGIRAGDAESRENELFRLAPLPNLLFSRDAQIVLGSGVVIGSMSRPARQREPLLARFIVEHHPRFHTTPILLDFLRRAPSNLERRYTPPTLEGGDILVFHEGVVIAGVSERTMEHSVDLLVEALRPLEEFHTLIMVPMPRTRSAMHLDTIFTRVSAGECLVYAPMVLPGHHETLSVVRIELSTRQDWGRRERCLLDALRRAGVDLQPIYCGGRSDSIRQSREQWTDGANSFALAPGVVMLYSRNEATAEEFAAAGYNVVAVTDMPFAANGACLYEFTAGARYAILVAGEELSRARGGPRCMTMPLARDGV